MALSARSLRGWTWMHKWSSLVCTLFMLLLCLTGLPLIFHDEIGDLTGAVAKPPAMPAGTPHISLDSALQIARARHPAQVVQFASQDEAHSDAWYVTLAPTPAPTSDFVQVVVDSRTGAVLPQPPIGEGFMGVMERLHTDLFAGQPGKLFLGAMGLLLVIAIVSGVVLYAPFMRKLAFGEVRHDRSRRVRWLDLHNLLGVATLAWALVVGATGVINTWAELLMAHWQQQELGALLAPYQGQPLVPAAERASLQRSLETAMAAAPGMKVAFIAFPGTAFSSPHHNTFYLRGNEPLTAHLLHTVMVDARSAQLAAAPQAPWYLMALRLSQPLHFGDYAGLPMKILWALLDIATIVVLGSGVYLWSRRRQPQALVAEAGIAFAKAPR